MSQENGDCYSLLSEWNFIPEPLLLEIFSYLSGKSILNAGESCSAWYKISQDDYLWKKIFKRDFKCPKAQQLLKGAESWYSEYQRLSFEVPLVLTEVLTSHNDQVLHVSFSNNGKLFATCSKDCFIHVWTSSYPSQILFSHNMKSFSWESTQFSKFNKTDTLILVSGVHFGSIHSTTGEIVVFTVEGESCFRCRIENRPYDVFGTWFSNQYLISGKLNWLAHLISASMLFLNKADQGTESESVAIRKQLYKFCNTNASSIRSIIIADCPWLDEDFNPEATDKMLTDNVSGNSSDEEDDESIEDNFTSLLTDDDLDNICPKYLIFTTGSLTYTPHEIGFKRIDKIDFPKKLVPGLSLKERILRRRREMQNNDPNNPVEADDFDNVDKILDLQGHIIGMGLSPDNKYLYANCRSWPTNCVISNPLEPPPIAEQIEIHCIDLTSLTDVGILQRGHKAYTSNTECFYLFLDVSNKYVASGAEDLHAYIWDRHYGICLAKYPHSNVVNSVAFNPKDDRILVTASDDHTIKVWRSLSLTRSLNIPNFERAFEFKVKPF